MSSTGNKFPTAGATVARGTNTDWTNPGNVVSDNTTDATCADAGGTGSDYLVASGFGFSIPAGATVSGITVRVEASEHSTSTEVVRAQLQDDTATLIGAAKTNTVSGTTKAVYTYGSSSDVWTATLTSAIINDADFGVRIWFETAHDVRIDYVTIAVEYVTALAAGGTGTGTSDAKSNASTDVASAGVSAVTAEATATVTFDASAAGSATADVVGDSVLASEPIEADGMSDGLAVALADASAQSVSDGSSIASAQTIADGSAQEPAIPRLARVSADGIATAIADAAILASADGSSDATSSAIASVPTGLNVVALGAHKRRLMREDEELLAAIRAALPEILEIEIVDVPRAKVA